MTVPIYINNYNYNESVVSEYGIMNSDNSGIMNSDTNRVLILNSIGKRESIGYTQDLSSDTNTF